MATTGDVNVDEGSTTHLPTYTVTEDAETKEIPRAALNNSAGTEIDTNSGTKSAATLRVVIATDQPALTNKLLVTPDLPTGAATAAKQPALGTAGTASADVITVQGKASMTPILTDGSATTQPVSGTFYQATQPVSVASIPSHAVTNAGTFAVQAAEADGANVTLGAKADAKSTATDTTAVTVMSVLKQISASVQAPPSQAVTNAGTFAVQDGSNKAEDAAHSSGDVGNFMLGVRNDALAAFSGTDLDYTPIAVTSAGRVQTTPASHTAMVRGLNSVAGTGDTAVTGTISGSAGLKTYITNVQVANTGASTTLITLKDGSGGSALAYTIAAASGGSNITFHIPLVTTANTALFFACGTSSTTVYVSAQGYLAP